MRATDLHLHIEIDEKKPNYVSGDSIRGTVSLRPDKDITLKSITIGVKCEVRFRIETKKNKESFFTEWTDLFDESRIVFPTHTTTAPTTSTLTAGEYRYSFEHQLPAKASPSALNIADELRPGVFWFVYVTVDRDSRVHHNHELKEYFEVLPDGWPVDRDLKDAGRETKTLKAYIPRTKPGGFRDMLKGQRLDTEPIDVTLVIRAPREGILQDPWQCGIEISFECRRPELFVLNEIQVRIERSLSSKHRLKGYSNWRDFIPLYERNTPISLEDFGQVQSEIMRRVVAGQPGMLEYDRLKSYYYVGVRCLIASRERPGKVEVLKLGRWNREPLTVLNRLCWPIGEVPPEVGAKAPVKGDSNVRADKVRGTERSAGPGDTNDKSERDGAHESKGEEQPPDSPIDDKTVQMR